MLWPLTRHRDDRRVGDSLSRQVAQSGGERNCHVLVIWRLIDRNAVDGATGGALQQTQHLLPACTTSHSDSESEEQLVAVSGGGRSDWSASNAVTGWAGRCACRANSSQRRQNTSCFLCGKKIIKTNDNDNSNNTNDPIRGAPPPLSCPIGVAVNFQPIRTQQYEPRAFFGHV